MGVTQGIQGICIPLGSFPGGYLADRTRRDVVLRAFGLIGFGRSLMPEACKVLCLSNVTFVKPAGDSAYLLPCKDPFFSAAFWESNSDIYIC